MSKARVDQRLSLLAEMQKEKVSEVKVYDDKNNY